jgi:hypothetical protein
MRQTTACLVGLVVAALIPAFVFAVFSPVVEGFDVAGILGGFALFSFFSLIVTAVLGVPAFLVLLRLRLVRWWSALLVGFVIGALVGVLIGGMGALFSPQVLATAGLGVLSSLAFWLVWKQGENARTG